MTDTAQLKRRKRAAALAAGLCVDCGTPTSVHQCCDSCRESRRTAARARYEAHMAAGLCSHCARPSTQSIYCADHYGRIRARRAR